MIRISKGRGSSFKMEVPVPSSPAEHPLPQVLREGGILSLSGLGFRGQKYGNPRALGRVQVGGWESGRTS